MAKYYVNKEAQINGDHEVHKEGCLYMPEEKNRIYIGEFSNCFNAVDEAGKYFAQVDGCFYCCKEAHVS